MTDIRNDAQTEQERFDLELLASISALDAKISQARARSHLANARLERARWHEAMAIFHVLMGVAVLALIIWGSL